MNVETKKRRPKGEEGGSIQLRNLDAEILGKIHELRDYFGVGTNSGAVLMAINVFVPSMKELQTLRAQLAQAREIIKEQQKCITQIVENIKTEVEALPAPPDILL